MCRLRRRRGARQTVGTAHEHRRQPRFKPPITSKPHLERRSGAHAWVVRTGASRVVHAPAFRDCESCAEFGNFPGIPHLATLELVGRQHVAAGRRAALLSAGAGQRQPQIRLVIGPALRSYEGRRRRHQRAGAALGFATCATVRLAGHPGVVGDLAADPLCRGCESRRCPCRRPIRGGLQAHDAVAPLDAAATGPDRRAAATETNGRGVCGDRRRPRSQMTKRKARVHITTALWPGRSSAGEGVGAGRRPAAVEIGDGRRCGPFCDL